ncbi:helix-hairpin-helix domain-containing protein [Chloroflexota bacterium]
MRGGQLNSIRSFDKWGLLLSVLLIIAIISGGIVFGLRQWDSGNSIEIIPASTAASTFDAHITGAVANEGIYTIGEDSSIRDILQGAGNVTYNADLTSIEIHIPAAGEAPLSQPQKININTAEAWLLEALPEIGPALAERIIEYRENEGPFQSIDELTQVKGIGTVTLGKVEGMICVLD